MRTVGVIGQCRRCRDSDSSCRIERLADLAEAVIGEEVEQPVLHDRTAYRSAELLLLVRGLRQQEALQPQASALVLVGERLYLVYGSKAFSDG